jgi:hypothetical protein
VNASTIEGAAGAEPAGWQICMEATVSTISWRRILKWLYWSFTQGTLMGDPLAFGAYLRCCFPSERAATPGRPESNNV